MVQSPEIWFHGDLDGPAAGADMLGGNHVPLTEQLFAEPNTHRAVATLQELHLCAAYGDAASGPAAFHHLRELRLLAAAFDCPRGNIKPVSNLLIRALQRTQLFQLH